MIIIDGKKLANAILENTKKEISQLDFTPVFCDILVGDDPSSAQYVRMKAKTAKSVGIKFHNANFPATITTAELIKEIKILNNLPKMCGIIVQLPLPESLDKRAILDAIDPHLDVDCLGAKASEAFYKGEGRIGPARNASSIADAGGFPTALACIAILDSLGLDLENKKIVCLGQGELVGKPVAALLRFRGLNPDIITRKTENKEELLKNADIIISGIGHGKHITGDIVKRGVVLVDAGTSEDSKRPAKGRAGIVGDVDLESVKSIASFVSPVPGGVGPVTVAMLLNNVLNVAKKMK